MVRKGNVSRAAFAIGLCGWGAQANAQDAPTSVGTSKDDIVVTAESRQELQNILSPGVVSVVYPDDTKGEQKSLPDLLDQVPGVYVRRVAGMGQYTTASIRGSAPSQVNVYIDGVPFNTASESAADLSTLPINDVARVEVYRGLTPARFSGAPIGGAINIVTRVPTSIGATVSFGARSWGGRQATLSLNAPLLGGGLMLGADLEQSRGDFAYRNIGQAALDAIDYGNAGFNGTDVSDTPEHQYSDPAQGGTGEWGTAPFSQIANRRHRLHNRYLKDNFLAKWKNDHLTLKYAFTHLDRDLPYPILPGSYSPVDDPAFRDPAASQQDQYLSASGSNQWRNQVQKQHDAAAGWQGKVSRLAIAANATFMDQDRRYRNRSIQDSGAIGALWSDYHSIRYGGALNLSYPLDEYWAVSQLFDFHAEHQFEKLNHDANGLRDPATGSSRTDYYTNFARHRTSFQLQDTITVPALHGFQVTPVARLEKLTGPVLGTQPNLLDEAPHTSGAYAWNWTYGASAKQKVGRDWLAYGSFGTYRRYPNFYEIYGDGIFVRAGTDSLYRTRPLLPEDGQTWDAGLGWNGTLLRDVTGSLRATYFYRKAINEITFFDAPLGARYINSGTTITRGGEFEGSLAWTRHADLQCALTVQEGHYRKGTYFAYPAVPVAERVVGKLRRLQSPPTVANARLNLHFLRGRVTIYGEVKYTSRNLINQDRGAGNNYDELTYEAPLTTFDLGAHAKLGPGFALSLGINDVLNAGPKQKIVDDRANSTSFSYYRCRPDGDPSCYDNPDNYITDTYSYDSNIYYPRQGRTVYVTLAKTFGPADWPATGRIDSSKHDQDGRPWTGFFVGGQVGAAWTPRRDAEAVLFAGPGGGFTRVVNGALQADPNGNAYLPDQTTKATTNAFFGGFDGRGAANGASRAAGIRRDRRRSSGYGARAGYDGQAGSWVFGVAAEWTHYNLLDSVSAYARLQAIAADGVSADIPPTSYVFTRRLNWVGGLRARLGYGWRGALGYLTGGPAMARIRHRFATTDTVNAFRESGTGSGRPGWQYGGGVEFRIGGPFRLGVEYLHTGLRDGAYTVTADTGASGLVTGFTADCNLPSGETCNTRIRRAETHYNIDALRLTSRVRF